MDVSIVITTFNYDQYLEECLNSCIDQEKCDLDYEIIVVDDGSTDETWRILANNFPPNVRIFSIKNVGIEKSSNFGFSKSTANYIVRVDADDILRPNYLASMAPYLSQDHGFFYSNYEVIDALGSVITDFKLPDFDVTEIINRGDFLATGTIVKAELLKRLKGYRTTKLNSGLENYDLILSLIQFGVTGYHVPETLFGYRRHGQNISDLKKAEIIDNGKELLMEKGLGAFNTNEFHPYGLQI